MAKATKQTKQIRRKSNDKVKSLAELPPFEPRYLMRVDAPGVSGDISDGDMVLLVRDKMPECGDLVCAHFKKGGALLITLSTALSEIDWRRMPFDLHPDSECVSLLMGTVLGSTKHIAVNMDKLAAVHKCEGRYDPEQAAA